jgi:hypothetical protein
VETAVILTTETEPAASAVFTDGGERRKNLKPRWLKILRLHLRMKDFVPGPHLSKCADNASTVTWVASHNEKIQSRM